MTDSILTSPTFLSYSLGCRTNQAEVESICSQLMAYGFKPFNLCRSEALKLCSFPSVVLLNTCVVTQKAEKETRQKIRELQKKYPKSFLVVLGCAVTAKEKFKIILPETGLYISNENKNFTVKILADQLFKKLGSYKLIHDRESFCNKVPASKYQLSGRKFIKVQNGCDKSCSYCITCHLRGKPTSIQPGKIIEEINYWVGRGIKEIILTGINIGLYNVIDRYHTCHIAGLLNKILSKTKIERISFSSIYPEMLTDDFIKLIVNNPRISQYFHLSLQSGSPSVLERMNRKTDLSRLKQKISRIKKQNPYFTFRADIITGFPNETETEFQEILDFIKKAKISFVHSFHFSARPNTKAEQMIKSGSWHEVPPAIKKQRAEILEKEVEKIRKEEAKKIIGVKINCLIVRELHRHSDQVPKYVGTRGGIPFSGKTMERDPSISVGMTVYEGITENGRPTLVQSAKCKVQSLKGKILPVKIIGFEKDYLIGVIG